ncbi:DUF4956 domain-containing protein [Mariniblastus fucicola]|nr:DUF4956 domain-containing protein [Mariniblastus fucicola]
MEFLEVPIFDDDFFKLITRLIINCLVSVAIVAFCYRRHQKGDVYVFSFLLINLMVFFLCFVLKKLDIGLGMALGLFAIFGIMRYRTDTIRVKEMTYLFILVGVAVINALSNRKTSYVELAFTNFVIVAVVYFLEQAMFSKRPLSKQQVVYDNLPLLGPTFRKELFEDLQNRTGLVPEQVKVSKMDLQKGCAQLVIYHHGQIRIEAPNSKTAEDGTSVGDKPVDVAVASE